MNRVKELRLKAGLQQKDIALALGIKQAAVSQWETQKSDPKPEHIPRLAEFFNVPAETIVSDNVAWNVQYPESVALRRSSPLAQSLSEEDIAAIAARVAKTSGQSLTPSEQELIDDFRQLTQNERHRIKAMIAGFLDAKYLSD